MTRTPVMTVAETEGNADDTPPPTPEGLWFHATSDTGKIYMHATARGRFSRFLSCAYRTLRMLSPSSHTLRKANTDGAGCQRKKIFFL